MIKRYDMQYVTVLEADLQKKSQLINELQQRLEEGRDYLMSASAESINAEDALEAFGFGRNGLF